MKKSELISSLKQLHPMLSNTQIKDIIELIFFEITKALASDKRIEIRGFGSFTRRKRKVQLNFPTESSAEIAFGEKYSVYFRMGKEFFEQLNQSK